MSRFPQPGERARVLIEGTLTPSDGGVDDAAIIGDHPDCIPLTDPKLVAYEAQGFIWEREGLIDGLKAIAEGRHTGHDANVMDWAEECPTCGPASYAQGVLEAFGLQAVKSEWSAHR